MHVPFASEFEKMSFEEDNNNEEEAMTIDIHQKRPSHWVAEELVHQGEESFQFHRGPRVGKRESSLTLFQNREETVLSVQDFDDTTTNFKENARNDRSRDAKRRGRKSKRFSMY